MFLDSRFIPVTVRITEKLLMKPLSLVRKSKKKTNSVLILGETIWMKKIVKDLPCFFFCAYVIFLVNVSIVVQFFMVDLKHAIFFHV